MSDVDVAVRDRYMYSRHAPRETEVYSGHHHDAEHVSEDDRCTDECFEPMTLCSVCGSAHPCLEIRAYEAAIAKGAA